MKSITTSIPRSLSAVRAAPAGVLRGAHDPNVMPALARHFRHQRSGLAAAEKKDVHDSQNLYPPRSSRNSRDSLVQES